ncbi:MAG: biotin/lipoyl-containing protein [Thermincolia bacterium]
MKKLKITVNGTSYEVTVVEIQDTALRAVEPPVVVSRPAPVRPAVVPMAKPAASATGGGDVKAPMPGVILGVKVKPGDKVKVGDVIVILEAMKMENEISAKKAGIIKEVKVSEGQIVGLGDILAVIE